MSLRALSPVALALLGSEVAPAGNWPGWRGPVKMGIAAETNLPVEASAATRVRRGVERAEHRPSRLAR